MCRTGGAAGEQPSGSGGVGLASAPFFAGVMRGGLAALVHDSGSAPTSKGPRPLCAHEPGSG